VPRVSPFGKTSRKPAPNPPAISNKAAAHRSDQRELFFAGERPRHRVFPVPEGPTSRMPPRRQSKLLVNLRVQVRMFDNGIEHALHFVEATERCKRRFAFLDEEFAVALVPPSFKPAGKFSRSPARPKFGGCSPSMQAASPPGIAQRNHPTSCRAPSKSAPTSRAEARQSLQIDIRRSGIARV